MLLQTAFDVSRPRTRPPVVQFCVTFLLVVVCCSVSLLTTAAAEEKNEEDTSTSSSITLSETETELPSTTITPTPTVSCFSLDSLRGEWGTLSAAHDTRFGAHFVLNHTLSAPELPHETRLPVRVMSCHEFASQNPPFDLQALSGMELVPFGVVEVWQKRGRSSAVMQLTRSATNPHEATLSLFDDTAIFPRQAETFNVVIPAKAFTPRPTDGRALNLSLTVEPHSAFGAVSASSLESSLGLLGVLSVFNMLSAPTITPHLWRLMTVVHSARCPVVHHGAMDVAWPRHPTGVCIGPANDRTRCFMGAAVMNLILVIVAFFLQLQVALFLRRRITKQRRADTLTGKKKTPPPTKHEHGHTADHQPVVPLMLCLYMVRFPCGPPFLLYMWLLFPSCSACISVLLYSDVMGIRVGAFVLLIIWALPVVSIARVLLFRFKAVELRDNPAFGIPLITAHKALFGETFWIDNTENGFKPAQSFVKAFGPLFAPFSSRRRHFLLVELSFMALLSLADSLNPDTADGCVSASCFTAACVLTSVLAYLLLQPFKGRLNSGMFAVVFVIIGIACSSIITFAFSRRAALGARDLAVALTLLVNYVLVVRCVADLVYWRGMGEYDTTYTLRKRLIHKYLRIYTKKQHTLLRGPIAALDLGALVRDVSNVVSNQWNAKWAKLRLGDGSDAEDHERGPSGTTRELTGVAGARFSKVQSYLGHSTTQEFLYDVEAAETVKSKLLDKLTFIEDEIDALRTPATIGGTKGMLGSSADKTSAAARQSMTLSSFLEADSGARQGLALAKAGQAASRTRRVNATTGEKYIVISSEATHVVKPNTRRELSAASPMERFNVSRGLTDSGGMLREQDNSGTAAEAVGIDVSTAGLDGMLLPLFTTIPVLDQTGTRRGDHNAGSDFTDSDVGSDAGDASRGGAPSALRPSRIDGLADGVQTHRKRKQKKNEVAVKFQTPRQASPSVKQSTSKLVAVSPPMRPRQPVEQDSDRSDSDFL